MPDRTDSTTIRTPQLATGIWKDGFGNIDSERQFAWDQVFTKTQSDIERHVSPQGRRELLPFETSWSRYHDVPCNARYINSDWPLAGSQHNCYPLSNFIGGYDLSYLAVEDNAVLKSLSKIADKVMGEFNLTVGLAEASESVNMITERAQRITRACYYFREGRFTKGWYVLTDGKEGRRPKHQRLRTPAAAFLEAHLGWEPLLSDIDSACKDIANKLYAPQRKTVSRRLGFEEEIDYPNGSTCVTVRKCTKMQIKLYVGTVLPPIIAPLLNPVEALWAKTSLSFVADWAYPVSDFLRAITLSGMVSGKWVTSTKSTCEVVNPRSTSWTFALDVLGKFEHSTGSMKRTVRNNPDIPLPSFRPMDALGSWQRCATALSLMTPAILRLNDSGLPRGRWATSLSQQRGREV